VTEKDMELIDHSVGVEPDEQERARQIDEMKKAYLEGAESDLKQYGIYDSDDEIDLSDFKSSRTKSKK